jgi:hypothetical protein
MSALTSQRNLMGLGVVGTLASLLTSGIANGVQAAMTFAADTINGVKGVGTNGAGTSVTITGGTSNGTGAGTSVALAPGAVGTGTAGGVMIRGAVYFAQPTVTAKTVSATLTGAEILAGIITGNQGAAGAASYQLPLGSSMQTAMSGALADRDSFDFSIINISTVAAEDITVTTNTNWTLVGSMVVESRDSDRAQSSGTFRAVRTAANTFTLYRIA